MVKMILTKEAINDLVRMDRFLFNRFDKHFDKIAGNPAGKHMKHGLPFYKEEVGQGRIVYKVENDTIFVLRCFASHKEYEKWYKS
jgi:mRNA-degrading endonuclease RelE of RelBE toxin-antitoxin system